MLRFDNVIQVLWAGQRKHKVILDMFVSWWIWSFLAFLRPNGTEDDLYQL